MTFFMSVSMDRRPLVAGEYWKTTSTRADGSPAKPDPYFGLAAGILRLISQTSHLMADFAESVAEPETAEPLRHYCSTSLSAQLDGHSLLLSHLPPTDTIHTDGHDQVPASSLSTRAKEIESTLLSWTYPHGHKDSALEQLAEAYRSAALIHVYRTLRR